MTDIPERVHKVKALVDKGATEGERAAARTLLNTLLKKYGIKESELEAETLQTRWFEARGEWEKRLLVAVCWGLFKEEFKGRSTYDRVNPETGRIRRNMVGIEMTNAEYIDVAAAFEFYTALYERELTVFQNAFINKHKLFLAVNYVSEGDAGYESALAVKKMAAGLSGETYRKQLESGSKSKK
jgi:hypothetical protein